MYGPFKAYLNSRFERAALTLLPNFKLVKSMSKGGGLTFRQKTLTGQSVSLLLQHHPRNDSCDLTLEWSQGIGRNKDIESYVFSPPFLEWRRTLANANLEALAKFCNEFESGCIFADDLYSGFAVNDLDLGLMTWAIFRAEYNRTKPNLDKVPWAIPAFTRESFLRGDDPVLSRSLEPNEDGEYLIWEIGGIGDMATTWSNWFEFFLERQPTLEELDRICGPLGDAIEKRVEILATAVDVVLVALTTKIASS